MQSNSFEAALERIDAALGRIEAVADRPAAPGSDIAERHDRLRAAVAHSLQELDAVIAGQQS